MRKLHPPFRLSRKQTGYRIKVHITDMLSQRKENFMNGFSIVMSDAVDLLDGLHVHQT